MSWIKDSSELTEILKNEWLNPQSGLAEPIVIEEESPQTQTLRLYVVWSKWAALSQQQRSEIVMDAFSLVATKENRPQDVARVTIAMGLTREDAERMQIQLPA